MRGRFVRGILAVVLLMALGVWSPVVSVAAAQPAPWVPATAGQVFAANARIDNGVTIDPGVTLSAFVVGSGGVPTTGVASMALDFVTKGTAPGQGSFGAMTCCGSRWDRTGESRSPTPAHRPYSSRSTCTPTRSRR